MPTINKDNKFVSYIIILVSLFILVLFTKTQISAVYENKDLKDSHTSTLDSKKNKLTELNNLKTNLVKIQEDIDKYTVEIKEDEIIDYLYSNVSKINWKNGKIDIRSLSIKEPKKNELWFNETLINLNVKVQNEKILKDLLNFLTSKNSKYKFFISSFSFPYGDMEWNYNISIPLRVLHK